MIFLIFGRSLPIRNRLDEEQWRGAFTYNKGHNQVGVDRGVPIPRFPPPYPHFPPPRPRFPPPHPPLPSPWNISPAPIEKKKRFISSYNLSFQCMDYCQGFKTVGQFVCSSVHLLVCFGILHPSQRPSRQHCGQAKPCLRRNGKVEGRQDRWEKKMQAQQVPVLL